MWWDSFWRQFCGLIHLVLLPCCSASMAHFFKWLPITYSYTLLDHPNAVALSSCFLLFPWPFSTPVDIFMPDSLWLCQVASCWGQICLWVGNFVQRYKRPKLAHGSVQVSAVLFMFWIPALLCISLFTYCSGHFFPVVRHRVPWHTNASFFSSSQLPALGFKNGLHRESFPSLVATNLLILKVDES